jgi:nucleoside-diphosphate-sugar epimerase
MCNLVNFARSSKAGFNTRFVFLSSISSAQSWKGEGPLPESMLEDWRHAVGTGYGESKSIAERVCFSP